MKFAVISDIHSNLYALETVLEDIKAKKVDAIFCTGDSVGYSPFPNEVINMMKAYGVIAIKGNYDDAIGNGGSDCGCGYKDQCLIDLASLSMRFTNKAVTKETKTYLRNLPEQLRLNIGQYKILFVHGGPDIINQVLREDSIALKEALQKIEENVLIFGHTHQPFVSEIEGKYAINSGSVGKPAFDDPRASYAMVEIRDDELKAEVIYIEYPVDKAVEAIYNHPELPNAFGDMLLKRPY